MLEMLAGIHKEDDLKLNLNSDEETWRARKNLKLKFYYQKESI